MNENTESLFERVKRAQANDRYRLYKTILTNKTRNSHYLRGATFELTPLCTLDCKMCYVRLNPDEIMGINRIKTAEEWIDLIGQTIDLGALNITFTGGEALLHPGFEEIYCYAYDHGAQITLMTNATVIKNETLELFKHRPPSFVCVTIYGYSADTYIATCGYDYFNEVVKNIRSLNYLGLNIQLQTTVLNTNANDVPLIKEFAESLDLPYFHNNILKVARLCDSETIEHYENYKHKTSSGELSSKGKNSSPVYGMRCGAGVDHFHVTWNGKMQPCATFNMIEESIDCIANSWERLNRRASQVPQLTECLNCIYENKCEQCIVTHYGDTHEFGKPSPRLCYKVQHGITD